MQIWNNEIVDMKFPTKLKYADITQIFKRLECIIVNNYRPVRIMQKLIRSHVDNYLSPYLCGYRKGYNLQYTLTTIIEKWKKNL